MKRVLCLFALSAIIVVSCGKKQEEKPQQNNTDLKTVEVKLNSDAPLYLLPNLTISGFTINDTINGIKAKVLSPFKKTKDNSFSIKPISIEAENQFKEAVAELKKVGKQSEPHSLLIRTVWVVAYNNLISALLEKEIIYAGNTQKDSLFFALTYNAKQNTPLKITEVLDLNAQEFEKLSLPFGYEEYKASQFAIGKDSLYIYPTIDGKQTQFTLPLQTIEHHIINDK